MKTSLAKPSFVLVLAALANVALVSVLHAQTDPSNFDTVINAPPTEIGDFDSIGSNVQLNVADGGSIGVGFNAGAADNSSVNTEVNISGGTVGNGFRANAGSSINISGGLIGSFAAITGSSSEISGGSFGSFQANTGSTTVVTGGSFGGPFSGLAGSDVTLVGDEFMFNGQPVSSTLPFSLDSVANITNTFSGTLSDGSVFIFTRNNFRSLDQLSAATLTTVNLPAADTTPIVLTGPDADLPPGLRAGQTLTLQQGDTGNRFNVVGATLDATNSVIGDGLRAVGSNISFTGSTVGADFQVTDSTTVDLSETSIQSFARVRDSIINVNNNSMIAGLDARDSVVNISSGDVRLSASDGFESMRVGPNTFNVSGGALRTRPASITGTGIEFSTVNLSGGLLDGIDFGASAFTDVGFRAVFSAINVTDGEIADNSRASALSTVNLSGGSIGDNFWLGGSNGDESILNFSGGSIGERLSVEDAQLNVFGSDFLLAGTLIELSPGESLVIDDRDVTLSGILDDGSAFSFELNSMVNSTSDYFNPGSTITINRSLTGPARDIDAFRSQLGLTSDAAEFDPLFDLNEDGVVTLDDYDLNITKLVETPFGPGTFVGDLNLDGDVDVSQIVGTGDPISNVGDASILLANLGMTSGALHADGDLNGDGDVDVTQIMFVDGQVVNVGDASRLLANLGHSKADMAPFTATAVPEPSQLTLLVLSSLVCRIRRRRRGTSVQSQVAE